VNSINETVIEKLFYVSEEDQRTIRDSIDGLSQYELDLRINGLNCNHLKRPGLKGDISDAIQTSNVERMRELGVVAGQQAMRAYELSQCRQSTATIMNNNFGV